MILPNYAGRGGWGVKEACGVNPGYIYWHILLLVLWSDIVDISSYSEEHN
jgi:hypothetical protein